MIGRKDAVLKLREWLSGGATVFCRAEAEGVSLRLESSIGSLTDDSLTLVAGGARLEVRLDLAVDFKYTERKESPLPSPPTEENEAGLVILFPPRGVTRVALVLAAKD